MWNWYNILPSMKQIFTDFSQLKKGMFKAVPPKEEKPEMPVTPQIASEDEEVLAYFSRPAAGVARKAGDGDAAALAVQLRESESARIAAEERLASSDRKCASLAAELAAAQKELARIQGDCGRLKGELRKALEAAPVQEEPKTVTSPVPARPAPAGGVLIEPAAFVEAFPGELREMLLSVLSDASDAARQGTRERRAAVLDAVLSENRSTGELKRRREMLKQIMKDSGGYTDPRALAAIGFKLVSGKTHWKVDYAGIRMPLSKTPSDYRANLNMATDMVNRCF